MGRCQSGEQTSRINTIPHRPLPVQLEKPTDKGIRAATRWNCTKVDNKVVGDGVRLERNPSTDGAHVAVAAETEVFPDRTLPLINSTLIVADCRF